MWAGGRLKWDTHSPLRIGQTVTEHTKVVKAEPKTNKHGGEMILAGVEKQYETQDGVVLTDQRCSPHTLNVYIIIACTSSYYF